MAPSLTLNYPNEGGQTFRDHTEVDPEDKGEVSKEKILDLGVNVEAYQHENLRTLRSCAESVPHLESRLHDQHEPEGRTEE